MDSITQLGYAIRSSFFKFNPQSIKILEEYLGSFKSEDLFENQFRSNLGSIAAAEFASLRRLLNNESPLSFPNPVLEIDSKLALLTADTLRTRPCRTAGATKRGRYFTADRFMLFGVASKAWYVLNESNTNPGEVTSLDAFLGMGTKLYRLPENSWENQRISDLVERGFDKLSLLFGLMRICVIRDASDTETESWFTEERRRLKP